MNADPYPHLDPEPLRQLGQLAKPEVVERMIGTFCESTESRINNMMHAVAGNDMDAVRFEAHTLKSSSASVGALLLSNLCLRLEQTIDSSAASRPVVEDLSSRIQTEFQDLKRTLTQQGAKLSR